MQKTIYIPEAYKNINKEELVSAFLGYNYELIVAIDNDELFDTLSRYLYNSIKQVEGTNEYLWKYLWISQFGFMANKMQYNYFSDCIAKTKILLPDMPEQKFEGTLRVFNRAIEYLTGRGPLNEPRLFNSLFNANFEKECPALCQNRQLIEETTQKHKGLFVFKCKNLNVNPYFNLNEFVFYTLMMLLLSKNATPISLAECLASVLDIQDTKHLLVVANELAAFFTKVE